MLNEERRWEQFEFSLFVPVSDKVKTVTINDYFNGTIRDMR